MRLVDYLWQRLSWLKQGHIFGIPGDFAIPLFLGLDEAGADIVTMAHEPGLGYAADAYARMRGFGTALVTYGPGALNLVNSVAQAYAERTPLLVISGAPSTYARERDLLLHHRIRDHDSQLRIFREVTCASAAIRDPLLAAADIRRVIRTMLEQSRPGYLEIPTDMVNAVLQPWTIPSERERPICTEDPGPTADNVISMLATARAPVVLAGIEIARFGMRPALQRFVERWNLPCMNTMLARAALSERHPNCLGTFQGALGDEATVQSMREADLVLSLGVMDTDVNLGQYSMSPADGHRLVVRLEAEAGGADLRKVLPALASAAVPREFTWQRAATPPQREPDQFGMEAVVDVINEVVGPQSAIITVDVGDILFASCRLKADDILAPCYYASMGFSVPAALGAELATGRRAVALVGDGAFQMTGNELGTAVRYGLSPIIVVLDNDGYETMRTLDEPRPMYATARWDYAAFAQAMGIDSVTVCSANGLAAALREALAIDRPFLIEASLEARASSTLTKLRELRAPQISTSPTWRA